MKEHKKHIIDSHFKTYIALFLGVINVSGVAAFYYLWFAPQTRVRAISNDTHELYAQTKEDTQYMEHVLGDWSSFISGDLESKTEKLEGAKENFKNFYNELDKISYGSETEELVRIMKEYAQKGEIVSENMLNVAQYFKKVEKAVVAFNKLNIETKDIEALKKLVLNFESVSSDSLSQLEEIAPPLLLLEVDKGYKDLLRQYIKSANALSEAIEKNNEEEITKVGKEADSQVEAISNQLSSDLDSFVKNSDMNLGIKIMKDLQKTADNKLENLKNTYRI